MGDTRKLYERLKKEKIQLEERLAQLQAREQPTSERREGSPFGKREEEADQVFVLEKNLALKRKVKEVLAEVEHTLKKYEAGTYGVCDSCGQVIEPTRLEALPQASLCLSCKASQARDAKRAR